MEELTRRERRKQFREEKQEQVETHKNRGQLVKWFFILLFIAAIGFGGWWFYKEITKPAPGQQLSDLGANHVTDITDVVYNSSPPTSGPHFPVWAKKGVYDRVISDGHLIHSLEHGYVVISYNCDVVVDVTYSHPVLTRMTVGVTGEMSFFGPTNAPTAEIQLPEEFSIDECKKLVGDLSSFVDDYQRVIVVPRPGMDSLLALTAWTRIDKINQLDRERIKNFIDYYHNKGPEKTVE